MLYILKAKHRDDKEQPLIVKSNGYCRQYFGVAYDYKDTEGRWQRASMPSSCLICILTLIFLCVTLFVKNFITYQYLKEAWNREQGYITVLP